MQNIMGFLHLHWRGRILNEVPLHVVSLSPLFYELYGYYLQKGRISMAILYGKCNLETWLPFQIPRSYSHLLIPHGKPFSSWTTSRQTNRKILRFKSE